MDVNSVASHQKEVLSPEDLAWADSCLIEDADILESTWNPMKNALLEIISSTPESFNIGVGADIEILPSIKEKKNAGFWGTGNLFSSVGKSVERINDRVQDDTMPYKHTSSSFEENLMPVSRGNMQESSHIDMEHASVSSSTYNAQPISLATANSDDIPDHEKIETLPSPVFEGNPFLPTYGEDLKDNGTADSGLDLDFFAHEMEQSSDDDIFKIWDLNIPTEDEFVKQLNQDLAIKALQMTPSSFGDPEQWKVLERGGSLDNLVSSKKSEHLDVLEEGTLDNLIDGFADLSLNS